ncbi:uncharacterized protein LOC120203551 [Hibiscus syriacus]|uniref:uncharacterized protein LOC120203551 n=1 Tax=Hibiscus syriacus TaxID=106335 RepID=UPI001920E81B|nr:uncharacterized protein LOC120203551 [Hibiscus syriacus]
MGQLEGQNKCCKELDKIEKTNRHQYWFQSPVEELDLSQLMQLKSAMNGLKNNVEEQKVAILNANRHQFFLGNSSQGLVHDYNYNTMAGPYNPVQEYSANPANGYNVTFRKTTSLIFMNLVLKDFKVDFFS